MRSAVVLLALFAVGCGKEIGDSCVVSSDCSPNGDRQCDVSQHEGYCTIQGCDFSTCPEEAACIRFFSGTFNNRDCDTQNDCSLDELCSLTKKCVPRSSDVRYCMRTCDNDGDCRDGYECRTLELMRQHGGEPVLEPGTPIDDNAPKFCAIAP
ncbi:MAG TPA: hypothetical protein VIV40_02580 [Kofleriaceae bacterium]